MNGTGRPTSRSSAPPLFSSGLLALLCVVLASCGMVGGGGACAERLPTVEAQPAQAASGETFRLHGEGFSSPGRERGECPERLPERGIGVEFVQGDRTWTLASVDSDENLTFDEEGLEVPSDAQPGEAVVRTTGGDHPPAETPFLVLG